MDLVTRPFKPRQPAELFWPLRDVTFEVQRGSAFGIVGENGTGKSTILKLIARILEPTEGQVTVNGRVATLLELGASFHPELTGRENIFLAASIANISRQDTRRDLDSIIEFADIGPYVDVPVKHYSSGMYVRLGFAVAMHQRPDILLIDEVLAVGDEAFQHKCLQAITRLQRLGAAIILVTHSMQQIQDQCDAALWLDAGHVRSIGLPERVVSDYLAASAAEEQEARTDAWRAIAPVTEVVTERRYPRGAPGPDVMRWGDGAIQIRDARLVGADGRPTHTFRPDQPFRLEFDYVVQRATADLPSFGIAIYRSDELWCYGTNTELDRRTITDGALPTSGTVVVEIPVLQILQGEYTVDVAVQSATEAHTHDYIREAASFSVRNSRGDQGVFRPELRWSLTELRTSPASPEKVTA
jgi:ABC-type polysaccharide/polyol phosphate transport system ATPase subunit